MTLVMEPRLTRIAHFGLVCSAVRACLGRAVTTAAVIGHAAHVRVAVDQVVFCVEACVTCACHADLRYHARADILRARRIRCHLTMRAAARVDDAFVRVRVQVPVFMSAGLALGGAMLGAVIWRQ